MKKKLFGLASLLFTLGLASCKPPLWFINDEGSNNYKDRQQLIFTHLWQRGSKDYKQVSEMIKTFNESDIAKELNVFVKGDGINFWDYWDKVNLMISGGNAPDIFIHSMSSTPTRKKQLLNLDEMYQKDIEANRETLDATEMFFESQMNDIRVYNDGDLNAWPFSSTVRVVWYNKTMFDEFGITELPKTWAEIEEINKKLTTYKDPLDPSKGFETIGFDPFCAEGQYVHQWGWLAGHDFWSYGPDGKPIPNFDDPQLVKDMNYLMDSITRKGEQNRKNLENWFAQFSLTGQNPFTTGKMGMMISNEGLYTTLKEANVDFEYGVFELPVKNEGDKSVSWSSSYSTELFDNAHRQGLSEEQIEQRNRGSWEFLKFLYGDVGQKVINDSGFMLSNRKYYDQYINNDPIKKALASAIERTKESEFIEACPNWTADIQTYVNTVFSYKMSFEDCLKNSQKLLEDKIELFYSTAN